MPAVRGGRARTAVPGGGPALERLSRGGIAEASGPGGQAVATLLDLLPPAPDDIVERGVADALIRETPAGTVDLPVAVVGLAEAVRAADRVDPTWLAAVDRRRAAARRALVDAGREVDLEEALHVAVLLATERFDPFDDEDVDAHVASGAQLWLFTGAVVSGLAHPAADPFGPWGRLVAGGWWPVGPSGGRLVLSRPPARPGARGDRARRAG